MYCEGSEPSSHINICKTPKQWRKKWAENEINFTLHIQKYSAVHTDTVEVNWLALINPMGLGLGIFHDCMSVTQFRGIFRNDTI